VFSFDYGQFNFSFTPFFGACLGFIVIYELNIGLISQWVNSYKRQD
jgi:hypothetical protein